LLYVPRNLPDPNSADYAEAVVRAAFPVLKASGGRAFFLCTSLRAMRQVHDALLAEWLARDGSRAACCCCRASSSKNELLERFRRLGNAILIGSQSFWEGRRCARRSLVAGGHRQAAVRAARRPGALGAHRAAQAAKVATPSWNISCRAP
jgi:Rad3-related DNA helicase